MNVTTTAPELPTTATALRTLAKERGLKGMSSANKATLVPAITEELERRLRQRARRVGPVRECRAPARVAGQARP